MRNDERDRAARALERGKRMTIHRAALGEPVDTDLVFGLAGMALAAELSRTAWILSGKEHPLRMDRTAVRFVPRS